MTPPVLLSAKTPFATGGHKAVYLHPHFDGRCLKVMKPGVVVKEKQPDDPLTKEFQGALAVRNLGNPGIAKHFPAYYGFVATDIGDALASELIRDSDGTISATLEIVLLRNGWDASVEYAIREFLACVRHDFFSYDDLDPGNLLYKRIRGDEARIVYAEYNHERKGKLRFSYFRAKRKEKGIRKMYTAIAYLLRIRKLI